MRFDNQVLIRRPVSEVFAFVADFTHMPLWNYYIEETAQESSGRVGVGTRYAQRRKTDTQQLQITDYEPDRRVAIRLLRPSLPLTIRFTFAETPEGTHLTDTWELWPKAPLPGVLTRLATSRVQAAVAENLMKLKALLERGEAVLQDGRVVRHTPGQAYTARE
ncbi:MAG TPA: SRPBCC family protein [Ktedonobacterales bacterium]